MTYWAEDFQKAYPNVQIEVEGKGSSTAPPALIQGTSQLGPMSRRMKNEEIDAFEKQFGYKPRLVAVAIDALAVYVSKDNPIQSLTLQQVDSIFSSTRRRGGQEINSWGELCLTGDWANKPISLYGRNSASGTYGFFKEEALKKGDYRNTVKEQPGSASVVQGVERNSVASATAASDTAPPEFGPSRSKTKRVQSNLPRKTLPTSPIRFPATSISTSTWIP
jgi:phosphate transport system substrate-binding protein